MSIGDKTGNNNKNAIRRAAMNLLARREYSYAELILKLKKSFCADCSERSSDGDALDLVIEDVVDQLREEKLQCDERYAEAFIRYHSERGKGPIWIRAELKARGIVDHIIDELLQESGVIWLERIGKLNQKKYGSTRCSNRLEMAKRYRFFQYRGFTSQQIDTVLSEKIVETV